MCWQWKCTITTHCTPVSEAGLTTLQGPVGTIRAVGGSCPTSQQLGLLGVCGVVALTLQWLPRLT